MANQFQPFDFTDVEDFLLFLPKDERIIVDVLRELIFECMPGIKEKLSYNVPFYSLNKRISYIWPQSVPWGKTKLKGVQLGMCQGNLLANLDNYFEKGNRKQVTQRSFYQLKDVEPDILKMHFFEAYELDLTFAKK